MKHTPKQKCLKTKKKAEATYHCKHFDQSIGIRSMPSNFLSHTNKKTSKQRNTTSHTTHSHLHSKIKHKTSQAKQKKKQKQKNDRRNFFLH